ncbi:MAG: LuxR C-terminal-related transcriptional regulator [Anaerolineae bacterium]|nr:LuxR C-terminal-related transcriptional regulator [Anaerolineae bacterium]
MEGSLLQTKLLIPPIRSSLIPRPQLIAKLTAGLNHRLTLVSAPAGFGKTTLVADWLSRVGRPSAWVSLDEDDNDLIRFFIYAAAAVQQIEGVDKSIQRLLQATQPVQAKTIVTAFINDCAAAPVPFLLVLDDYHFITDNAIHEAVAFLLDHLPVQLHLLITSRTDPLLPLPRLRARGQLTELRSSDLRFSIEEATAFLRQVMGLDLSVQQVSALETRTEGWVAGLQMAALSIQGLEREDDVSAFVTDFAGSHRYVFDYLTDEVLQQRPPHTRTFLLETSILDRFNASLCAAVTGQPDCARTLASLERANLFLFPLDEQRQWYRYHHLFAELLRRRLLRTGSERMLHLYRRAAEWFAVQGDVETAVKYALAGEEPAMAASWLDAVALDYVARSHMRQLLTLARRLPFVTQGEHIRLCLALAWSHVFSADLAAAENYRARSAEAISRPTTGFAADFPPALARAHLITIEAFIATRRAKPAHAVALTRQALALLAELPEKQARQLRGSILINLGQALTVMNEVADAEAAFRQAIQQTKAVGRVFGVMAATSNIVKLQRKSGLLAAAKLSGRQALAWLADYREHADVAFPAEGEVRRELAVVCYELNQLEEACHHVQVALNLYRDVSVISTSYCLHLLFKLELAAGEVQKAIAIHDQIDALLLEMTAAFSYPLHIARRADRIRRLRKAQPQNPAWEDALRGWAAAASRDETSGATNIGNAENAFLRACVAAALSDDATALRALDRLVSDAQIACRHGDLVQYHVQEALVLDHMGERDIATTRLAKAIWLAETSRHLRTFLDDGHSLRHQLHQVPQTAYSDLLLREIGRTLGDGAPEAPAPAVAALVDPLSERELEVLALLITHLTGPEIARRLHISHNTLKTHIRNIYGKLGVHSRTAAVARSQALGLLT